MKHPLVGPVDVLVSGPDVLRERIMAMLPPPSGRASILPRLTVELRLSEGDLHEPGTSVFKQPGVAISSRPGEGLVASGAASSALIGDGVVDFRLAPGADRPAIQPVFDVSWPLLLPAHGMYHVHGAMLRDPYGTGWLLAGDANIGKSTTTLSLVRCGWSYAADDAVYLSPSSTEITADGWEEPIRLTARSAAALDVTRQHPDTPLKSSALLDPALAVRRIDRCAVHRVLLPELGAATDIQSISAHQALTGLIRASAWIICMPRIGGEYMRLLGRVASLPAARLVLGPELLDEPHVLADKLLDLAAAA
ncbi:MAG TPA: hypothetical protein VJ803_09145 [Gemmatimonadaceae bacterium]|nr:hypothetical protein [Gemmatimonadaceae bacterium]